MKEFKDLLDQHTLKIFEAVNGLTEKIVLQKGVRYRPDRVFFIVTGNVTFYKADSPYVFDKLKAPVILGLTSIYGMFLPFEFSVGRSVTVEALEPHIFMSILKKTNHFEEYATLITSYFFRLFIHDNHIFGNNAYTSIKSILLTMCKKKNTISKERIVSTISQRSGITRSYVSRIINALVFGGYVTFIDNRVVILKPLPDKY